MYTRFIHLCFAVALSCAVASLWLFFRIQAGAVEPFAQNLAMAGALGLIAPIVTTLVYVVWRRDSAGRMLVYYGTCVALAAGLAIVLL
ncbi:MAG: hypothetical protein AAF610_06910 [Pseudomonadota bacterium]